jgi:hypothetical protein
MISQVRRPLNHYAGGFVVINEAYYILVDIRDIEDGRINYGLTMQLFLTVTVYNKVTQTWAMEAR